jgi:LacI family transcriptional regulator
VTPTLADIARSTGTSISTVSRVLSGGNWSTRISEKTRLRVEQTARQMGYQPNLLARSLRTRRTNTVALLVSDIANPWFGRLASLIEQALHQKGYSLVVCNSGEDKALEREYMELLPRKGIDGLIVVPLARQRTELAAGLPAKIPLVVLDRPIAGGASVAGDPAQTAILLCDALSAARVERVALVAGPSHVVTHQQRARTIRERFEVLTSHEGPAQQQTGRQAAAAFRGARFDAVVCTNNFLGQGYLEAAGEVNCLGCFDEIAMMQLVPVPIVCCTQDVPRLAEESVRLLLQQLAGAAAASSPLLVPSSIVCNRAFERWAGAR